jgi:hypothetical protein
MTWTAPSRPDSGLLKLVEQDQAGIDIFRRLSDQDVEIRWRRPTSM